VLFLRHGHAPIQYTKTEDGFNIAWWEMGNGYPLLLTSPVNFTHVEIELRISPLKRRYDRLAESLRIIRFDGRGWGLSDRRARGYDLEWTCTDIDTVAAAANIDTFALFGFFGWAPSTIGYAATRPGRVSHLLTWVTGAQGNDAWVNRGQMNVIRALTCKDWDLYTENMAHVLLGWGRGEVAHEFANLIRASMSQEFILSWRDHAVNDGTPYLGQVRCPALILHTRDNPLVSIDDATALAAGIPGARRKWTVEELQFLAPNSLLAGVPNPAPPPPELEVPGRPVQVAGA